MICKCLLESPDFTDVWILVLFVVPWRWGLCGICPCCAGNAALGRYPETDRSWHATTGTDHCPAAAPGFLRLCTTERWGTDERVNNKRRQITTTESSVTYTDIYVCRHQTHGSFITVFKTQTHLIAHDYSVLFCRVCTLERFRFNWIRWNCSAHFTVNRVLCWWGQVCSSLSLW